LEGVGTVTSSSVLTVATADIWYVQFNDSSACFGRSFERHQPEKGKHKGENVCRYSVIREGEVLGKKMQG